MARTFHPRARQTAHYGGGRGFVDVKVQFHVLRRNVTIQIIGHRAVVAGNTFFYCWASAPRNCQLRYKTLKKLGNL